MTYTRHVMLYDPHKDKMVYDPHKDRMLWPPQRQDGI